MRRYLLPLQGPDFGNPHRGEGQQGSEGIFCLYDSIHEHQNFLRLQKRCVPGDGDTLLYGWQGFACFGLDNAVNKGSSVFQCLIGAKRCLLVYDALPLVLQYLPDFSLHNAFEAVSLYVAVASYGGRGEDVFPLLDVVVDGFG